MQGVRTNQKVCRHPAAGASTAAIIPPRPAGFQRCFERHWAELDAQPLQRLARRHRRREERADFRPHHCTRDQLTLGYATPQQIFGGWAEGVVGPENIKPDLGVDGGNHRRHSFPRNSAMRRSVE